MHYKEILKNLIAIDTTMPTLKALEWVKDYLAQQDILSEIVYTKEKETGSLVATIGDKEKPGIIFSGHLDVVPVSSDWKNNPFELCEENGFLFGRGTTDMKGAIAVALSLVSEMKCSGKTFHFVLTGDEETTCRCVQDVLKIHSFPNALGCVVMEATECQIIIGHKTISAGQIIVHGKSAHSSEPAAGINALTHAVLLHQKFYQLAANLTEKDDLYKTPTAVAEITTCRAGIADNVIPNKAEMSYNIRCLNEVQQNHFLSSFEEDVKKYEKSISGLSVFVFSFCHIPGFNMDFDHPFVKEVLRFASLATPSKVSYATEGGYFNRAGIPVVIWGPGTILSAHQVNESIALSELKKYKEQLHQFIER